MGGHQHAAVVELHQPALAYDGHLLARQPAPDAVLGGGETDVAPLVDLARGRRRDRRLLGHDVDGPGLHRLGSGEAEPLPGPHHADALVRSVVVVVLHPRVELLLRLLDRVEGPAVEELAAQRAVEALHLARRRGRPGCGEQVADAVHYANTPPVRVAAIRLNAPNTPLRSGAGDR
jgi:hypothetical protein